MDAAPASQPPVVVAPTITRLPDCAGAVLVTGSHGGRYCGRLAILARVRAAIFHDAGVGLDQAGIGALAMLNAFGIPAAAISHQTARVGDVADMMERGAISHANAAAGAAGVTPGLPCAEAAERLRAAPHRTGEAAEIRESRLVTRPDGTCRNLVLIDSASLVEPSDEDAVVVTGSHGGLVGGDPAMALRVQGFAAVFNDAGIGIDNAGTGRLAPLAQRGIAAITVAASSARIGDAASTLGGVVSAVNAVAEHRGARSGMLARDVVMRWCRAAGKIA
jgi:hypothetical protein